MALTQVELSKLTCGNPDCQDCANDVLVLRSRCHMHAPTWTEYNKNGTVRVFCSVCDRTITEIAVAKGVADA